MPTLYGKQREWNSHFGTVPVYQGLRIRYLYPFKGTPWDETFSMLSILKI